MKRSLFLFSSIIVGLLLLPPIFKDKHPAITVGPELSDLTYTEVTFENTYEGHRLAGMLFVPDGEGPFPVAVIIRGSGPSSRNDSIWYLAVAEHLQANGIAVLLPDKRGSDKSEGVLIGSSLESLATDTLSAVEYVQAQHYFTPEKIGLIGMSQGCWIASIVASQSDAVSFAVSMSGGGVTTDEQLLHEEIFNIEPYTYPFIARLIAPLTTNNLKSKASIAPLMGFDPIPYWKEVHVPVFFAMGSGDRNYPVEETVERLEENNLLHFLVKVYPDGGHGIVDQDSHRVRDDYLRDLVDFMRES